MRCLISGIVLEAAIREIAGPLVSEAEIEKIAMAGP